MGRELKRVPVDFDWPINKVWEGYLMPDDLTEASCPAGEACRNGQTAAGAWVMGMASMMLMLDDDLEAQARGRRMHPYFDNASSYGYGCRPSADIRELGTGLAGREAGFMGHDSSDTWRAFRKIVEAAGLPETWGQCPTCEGRAFVEKYPGQRADAERWEVTEPPVGEGWQIWETVSEGSPITPVFLDAESLARHYVAAKGGSYWSVLAWLNGPGWSPSGLVSLGGARFGDELVTNHTNGSNP